MEASQQALMRPSVTGRASWVVALVVGAMAMATPAATMAADRDGLSTLLARFSQLRGFRAEFTEQKHITLLVAPLSSKGTVHFAPPDTFLRVTEHPEKRALWLRAGRLRLADRSGTRSIDTSVNPLVELLIGSWMDLLRGDRKALEHHYVVVLELVAGGRWVLKLTPRNSALRKRIQSIRFEGRGLDIQAMLLLEGNGDRTETTFRKIDRSRRYGAGELAKRFSRVAEAR